MNKFECSGFSAELAGLAIVNRPAEAGMGELGRKYVKLLGTNTDSRDGQAALAKAYFLKHSPKVPSCNKKVGA